MTKSLTLKLFGGLQIALDGKPLTKLTKKEQALLGYLAVTGRTWSRDSLSTLLWSEVEEAKARKSLGVALTHLRRHLADYLHITRQEIGLKPNQPYWLDVSVFLEAFPHQFDHAVDPTNWLKQEPLLPEQADCLKKAIELYQGSFLDGFSVIHAPLFEEWVLNKQEQFHLLAIQAFYQLAGDTLRRADYKLTIEYLRQLVSLDPLQEEAHQYLMLAYANLGQQVAAVQQYETCRRVLDKELGLTPMPETTALYQQIKTGNFALAESRDGPASHLTARHNLPAPVMSFVGRKTELANLVQIFKNPDYRLLTIVGPGGAGKTRLAIISATELLDQFPGGTWFVSLTDLPSSPHSNTPGLLASAIAKALNFSFSGPKTPSEQILNYLRQISQPVLFILDNFEPHLFDTKILLDILQTAPTVTLMVTARSRLNFQSEYVIPITGLPVPPSAHHPQAATYDSVQLFVERAARQKPEFILTEENLPHIIHLCQLVQGIPLAIELAASRLPELSCANLVTAMQQDIDVLSTSLHDVPDRHRSMRAVFEQAWRLLSEPEQLLLAQITLFNGLINAEATQTVTDIAPQYLKTLTQKSLLKETSSTHYELHSLLRQFAQEKLQQFIAQETLDETKIREKFSKYHLAQTQLSSPTPDFQPENIWQAWRWIVEQSRFDLIEQYTASVAYQLLSAGLIEDGEIMFQIALDKLQTDPAPLETTEPARVTATAALLGARSLFLNKLGHYEAGETAAQTAVTFARQVGHHQWQAAGHLQWGYACYYRADYEAAQQQFEQVLLLTGNLVSAELGAALQGLGGIFSEYYGNHARAADYLQRALHLYQQLADWPNQAQVEHSLGIVAGWLTNYPNAEAHFQQALNLNQKLGFQSTAAMVRVSWAVILAKAGRLPAAMKIGQQALQIFQTLGDCEGEITVLSHLGAIAEKLGDGSAARRYFEQASQIKQSGNFQVLQTIPILPALSDDMR